MLINECNTIQSVTFENNFGSRMTIAEGDEVVIMTDNTDLKETYVEIYQVLDLLDKLDGYGLLITDDDLLRERLKEFGIKENI